MSGKILIGLKTLLMLLQGVMESMRDKGWTRETKEAEQIKEDDIRWECREVCRE